MKKILILVFLCCVVLVSCTKNTVSIKSNDLAGTWLLKQYSGGFAGGTYTPKDKIVISFTSSRKYTSSINDTIISQGNYTITKPGDPNYYYRNEIINLSPLEAIKLPTVLH